MKYAKFGSISSDTMLLSDLIPVFVETLESLARQNKCLKQHRQLITEARACNPEDDSAAEILSDLDQALSEFAPPYAYFGAHPSDGAAYGFWLSDSFDEDFEGLKVADLSDVPNGFSGEVLQVSDHGNPTLYQYERGRGREIWAVV